MFKCYKLEKNDELKNLIAEYESIGENIMSGQRKSIKKSLDSYVRDDGFIDFTNLQKHWFPVVDSDIFISHSHKDIKIVTALVGWLNKKFGVEVFVDSYIWDYCNDLLKDLDIRYCKHENGTSYDYDKRNVSTAHVHMMLANSLNKMIDKSECVIFLESDNSLNLKNDIEVGTSSAWIYSEVVMSSLIRTKYPKRYEENLEILKEFYNMNPIYRINEELKSFIELKPKDLKFISELNFKNKTEYLDIMYKKVKGS